MGNFLKYKGAGLRLGAGAEKERENPPQPSGPWVFTVHKTARTSGSEQAREEEVPCHQKTFTKCTGSPQAGLGREGREPPQGAESWRETGLCQKLKKLAASLQS